MPFYGPSAGGGGAITREGGNTTEGTTTSTSEVDLLAATSLTLAALAPLNFICGLRKTTGAAALARIALRLNTTDLQDAEGWCGSGNAAIAGFYQGWCGARLTNYTTGGWNIAGASDQTPAEEASFTAATPTVEITDVVMRAQTGSASITMGADELHVYSMAVS